MTNPNTPANGGQILTWRERLSKKYPFMLHQMNAESLEALGSSSNCMQEEIADLRAYVAGLIVGTESLNATIADLRASLAAPAPKLSVWYGAMPESNGKSNFTAILHSGDISEGITLDRSEYPDRVRYEADCARHVIGELAERPPILDYDADKRSDYAAPAIPTVDRNSVLEECAALAVQWGNARVDDGGGHALRNYAEAVRALKSAAPASVPGNPTYQQIADYIDRPGFAVDTLSAAEQRNLLASISELMAIARDAVAQPAAQVAVSEDARRLIRAVELLTEACTYVGGHSWSPSMLEEIERFLATPATVKPTEKSDTQQEKK